MKIYKNEGYTGIENLYYKEVGIRRYKSRVKAIIPLKIKRIVKQYI